MAYNAVAEILAQHEQRDRMCDLGGAGQCSTVGPAFVHHPRLGQLHAGPETLLFRGSHLEVRLQFPFTSGD